MIQSRSSEVRAGRERSPKGRQFGVRDEFEFDEGGRFASCLRDKSLPTSRHVRDERVKGGEKGEGEVGFRSDSKIEDVM